MGEMWRPTSLLEKSSCLPAVCRPPLDGNGQARSGAGADLRRSHPRRVPRSVAGLQLLSELQLEAVSRRGHHRQIPTRPDSGACKRRRRTGQHAGAPTDGSIPARTQPWMPSVGSARPRNWRRANRLPASRCRMRPDLISYPGQREMTPSQAALRQAVSVWR